jgi:hypothetical protein
MATLPVINFHNQQMAEERARVMLRVANGTKASSSALIGRRMMDPSFKGLPANSTGSRNMPFFAAKDEVNVPLEAKIQARGGMMNNRPQIGLDLPAAAWAEIRAIQNAQPAQPAPAFFGRVRRANHPPGGEPPGAQQRPLQLQAHNIVADQRDANPNIIARPFIRPRGGSPIRGGVLTDYKYARKILGQRKADIENQLREEAGMPFEPGAPLQLSELDSRKLELAQLLDYVAGAVDTGEIEPLMGSEMRNLMRLMITLSPFLDQEDLASIVNALTGITLSLEAITNDITQGLEYLDDAPGEIKRQQKRAGEIKRSFLSFKKMLEFLEQMNKIVTKSPQEKAALATTLARELGSSVGLKPTLAELNENLMYYMNEANAIVSDNSYIGNPLSEGPTSSASSYPSSASSEVTRRSEAASSAASSAPAPAANANAIYEPTIPTAPRYAREMQELAVLYDTNDIEGLQRLLSRVAPRLWAEKWYGDNVSRVVLRNAILKAIT